MDGERDERAENQTQCPISFQDAAAVTGLAALHSASEEIINAVLRAADPRKAVERSLGFHDQSLSVGGREIALEGELAFVAAGKASPPMAEAFAGVFGDRISRGIVVMPRGYSCDLPGRFPAIEAISASHPIPDDGGLRAARRVLELVGSMAEGGVCVVLLSGGSSSLLSLPLTPLDLQDLRKTTELLLKSGIDIKGINTVRKHLSAIAGGRLAAAARCRMVTLAISDVVGDALPFIASGPTVADPTTFEDALGVLERLDQPEAIPPSVLALLRNGAAGKIPETPKSLPDRHMAEIIASNAIAVEAAVREAEARGFNAFVLTSSLHGEARDAGRLLAASALEAKKSGRPATPPACIIAGGETTVTVRGAGRGGRNQELALSAAIALEGSQGILLCSLATDGVDGNAAAAGARVTGDTVNAGRAAGMDPARALRENDSNTFLSAAGALIVTGPTYTNVNDVSFVLVGK